MQPTMTRLVHLVAFLALGLFNTIVAQIPPVDLGSAATYALFSNADIESNSFSPITGNVAIFPSMSSNDVRFPSGSIVGDTHLGDDAARDVFAEVVNAYADASSRTGGTPINGDLGTTVPTLTPGVYTRPGTLSIDITASSTLTIDGQGNPNAVFIIQTKGNLVIQNEAKIRLINGASACRIFWAVQGYVSFGANAIVSGNFLARNIFAQNGGTSVEGGLYAYAGSIRLNDNPVTRRTCPAPLVVVTTTTTTTTTTATTPGPTVYVTKYRRVTVTRKRPCFPKPTKPPHYGSYGDREGNRGWDGDSEWIENGQA
ncbi:hypothetical protein QBC44DRAFT_397494 [Cladorrhinum sp. PSN332]|nr:hypothetical protein QBC44DRAFT_397494 [Cladorrhinum sp. PSN332]